MESEFFSMRFSSWRSSQSRMPSFLSWHRMPTDDSTASVWSWHLQEPSGPDVVHASSRPFTLCQQFLSRHDAGYHGFLLHHQSLCHPITECSSPLNCQLAILLGDPKQRPLACPRGNFSIAGKRGSTLNKHPVLKFSFEPPPTSKWSDKIWPSLVLKEWISLVQVSQCNCLAQEMKRHQTDIKVTLKTKQNNPNRKFITAKMGWSTGIGWSCFLQDANV